MEFVPKLAEAALSRLGQGAYQDLPVTGTVAAGVGCFELAHGDQDRGLALLALSAKARARQDIAALQGELDAVRHTGSAREVDEVRVGRSAVAVPVRDVQNAVVGCLAAIGKTGRLAVDDPELTDLLRSCAARVSGRVPA